MQLEAFCRLFALGQPLAMALISFRQTKSKSLQYMGFSALTPIPSHAPPLPEKKPCHLSKPQNVVKEHVSISCLNIESTGQTSADNYGQFEVRKVTCFKQ